MPAIKKKQKPASNLEQTSDNLFLKVSDKPRFTGNQLITMNKMVKPASFHKLTKNASLRIASTRDFSSDTGQYTEAFKQGDGLYFDAFKIAVINKDNEEQVKFMQDASAGTNDQFLREPERYVYAFPKAQIITEEADGDPIPDRDDFTWGAQAIKLANTKFTGKDVNIAILDTGLNFSHPDFKGLNIISQSFVKNQKQEDKNGHGTHCCGVAVGGINKKTGLRYGVAIEANLLVGKVLSNAGSGSDSSIIAGIEWALQNKSKVISMSLGSEVRPNEKYSPAYERIAKTALSNNCLIVAAAGNESQREFGDIKPVGHPANCPSVLAVAAIDNELKVAGFSCGGINLDGGQVDIAAPGVNIYSSWIGKTYKTISGTSMATPFVAGVAALYFQANPKASAADIWMMLSQYSLRLTLLTTDVGSGLLQTIP